MVPITDSEWSALLEQVGLIDHHPHPARACELSSWHYCPACRRLRPVDRVVWWAPRQRKCQFENRDCQGHAAQRFHASATDVGQ
jgi:hypothetical protein